MVQLSINELYSRAKEGDRDAENLLFATLTARFRLFVQLRKSNVTDSEDIVQNAIIVIYEKYRDIEITTSFAGWAYKVLQLTLLGRHKEIKRRLRLEKTYQEIFVKKTSHPDISFKDLKTRVINCFLQIHRVKPNYARVLNLIHQGYTTEEICERMKISSNNLYTILSRARTRLFKCLEKGKLK